MKAHGLTVEDDLTAYGYYDADSAKYHVPEFFESRRNRHYLWK